MNDSPLRHRSPARWIPGRAVLSLILWSWTAVAVVLALVQWREIRRLRTQLADVTPIESPDRSPAENSANSTEPRSSSGAPSPELLQARATVAQLMRELTVQPDPAADPGRDSHNASDELERLMQGRTPADHPDFVAAEALQNRGFASPEAALETFWWSYAGRNRDVKFEDLWWSPTEPAGEGYHYEIFLGQGVGPFTGYRVVSRAQTGPDEVLFTLQRQEQHSVIEEQARFIRTDTGWKRMPAIRRVKDEP